MKLVKLIVFTIVYWFIAIPMSKALNNAVGGLLTALLIEVIGYYFLKWLITFIINKTRVKGSG